ncbi:uncharacterized protein BO80DRAFT_291459 [Aspergillus ibericus CBS 121593]|uniref:Uncharacterized protein n=1 Tax=Aspergillus ibericus CBS 121593 TaxID=1448316 RepID=A0A395GI44_9EURO|nr:hypothetical protein BO80DRAFT_291459 [Aspergillus ibericus CBS 121593]RAK94922.1 hypothetical protein BO80DRAFT_291459 [Aspergillus ibericus CBS 121593]
MIPHYLPIYLLYPEYSVTTDLLLRKYGIHMQTHSNTQVGRLSCTSVMIGNVLVRANCGEYRNGRNSAATHREDKRGVRFKPRKEDEDQRRCLDVLSGVDCNCQDGARAGQLVGRLTFRGIRRRGRSFKKQGLLIADMGWDAESAAGPGDGGPRCRWLLLQTELGQIFKFR